MPLKASPEDQALLLDLQAIDTKLQQLAHRANTLPQIATLKDLGAQAEETRLQLMSDSGALEDARTELKRIESDVEVVQARITRDTGRLDSSSSMKDVAGLEAELTSLRKRLSDLEDIELGVMERIEELEAEEAATRAKHEELTATIADVQTERDAAHGSLDSERAHANANRATIAGKLPAELLALYERQRERYGTGASLLQGGVSSASGVRLTESDMAEIRSAAPDDVVLCPDSNAILVRTAESGI